MKKAQMKMEQVLITPKMAEELLRKNTSNRSLSVRQLERMVHAMKNDQWKLNGETIKIAASGRLIDGQHRLTAIVQSGCSCEMIICHNVPESVIDTIDIGKRRSFSDWLNIAGEEHYSLLSASLNKLALYNNYFAKGLYVGKPGGGASGGRYFTYQDLEKILKENPGIRQSVGLCNRSEARRLFEKSILATMHYLFTGVDPDKTDTFFASLASGANLSADSPILTLRNTALKWKENNKTLMHYEVMCFFIRTWNAYITETPLVFLRFNANESFPVPLTPKAEVKTTSIKRANPKEQARYAE